MLGLGGCDGVRWVYWGKVGVMGLDGCAGVRCRVVHTFHLKGGANAPP